MSATVIKNLSPEDIPAVLALERASFAHPWTDSMVEAELKIRDSVNIGAFDKKRLAGYIAVRIIGEDAEVMRLAVLPDSRRAGIGRKLVDEAVGRLRASGVKRVFLELREGNKAAMGLYESAGFKLDGRRKGYYADGGDASLMSLVLN